MTQNKPKAKCNCCDREAIYMGYCEPCFKERQSGGYFNKRKTKEENRAERNAKKGRVTK